MTWNELAETIRTMPAGQKKREVLMIEDYDGPERRAVVLGVVKAKEDVYCGIGIGNELILLKGHLYLTDKKSI